MARPPRIDFADAVYHVTSRGNGRAKIFWSDADCLRFLAQLADNVHHAGSAKVVAVEFWPAGCRVSRSEPLEGTTGG